MKALFAFLMLVSSNVSAFEGRFSFGGELVAGVTSWDISNVPVEIPDYHQDTMGGFFLTGEVKVSDHIHLGANLDVSWVDNSTEDAGIIVLPQLTFSVDNEMGGIPSEFPAAIGLRLGLGPSFYVLSEAEESTFDSLIGAGIDSNVGLGVAVDMLLFVHVADRVSVLLTLGYQGTWNRFEVSWEKLSIDIDQSVHAMHFRMGFSFGE